MRYTSKFRDGYCIDAKDVHLIDGKLVGEPIDRLAELEELRIPKKPEFVDTRFRNHGRRVSDGSSLDKCYKCPNPNCATHIFHVFSDENFCERCGQALDWSDYEG